mmetsp:Transcript_15422/g.43136  ORF Transcript_15422/g.43136 Transcript_15422/m.43136 type:complete len:352 (-) Transcript_15422:4316-5371(-)
MALAVTAMIGVRLRLFSFSQARMSRVASQPSFTGMLQSMNTISTGFALMAVTASAPLIAGMTWALALASSRVMRSMEVWLSSASKQVSGLLAFKEEGSGWSLLPLWACSPRGRLSTSTRSISPSMAGFSIASFAIPFTLLCCPGLMIATTGIGQSECRERMSAAIDSESSMAMSRKTRSNLVWFMWFRASEPVWAETIQGSCLLSRAISLWMAHLRRMCPILSLPTRRMLWPGCFPLLPPNAMSSITRSAAGAGAVDWPCTLLLWHADASWQLAALAVEYPWYPAGSSLVMMGCRSSISFSAPSGLFATAVNPVRLSQERSVPVKAMTGNSAAECVARMASSACTPVISGM